MTQRSDRQDFPPRMNVNRLVISEMQLISAEGLATKEEDVGKRYQVNTNYIHCNQPLGKMRLSLGEMSVEERNCCI